jgi:hypothetical protein
VSGLTATAILMFTVFAGRIYIAGLDYSKALRAHGRPGLLGFDEELARPYNTRPLRFFRDAVVKSSLGVVRSRHIEPELRRRRFDYLLAVVGMIVSFLLIWPLSVLGW